MWKYSSYILASLTIVLLLSSCAGRLGEVKARLGEEFSLHIGQSAIITEEDLRIKFVEVSEDSRCAKDVICIWEGKVTAVVEISIGGSSQQLNLSQPGLTDEPAMQTYRGYKLTYKVVPYPEKAAVEPKNETEKAILTAIQNGRGFVDEIAVATELGVSVVLEQLLDMELRGLVRRTAAAGYEQVLR